MSDAGGGNGVHVVKLSGGEIHPGFEHGDEVQKLLLDGSDATRECAPKLMCRGACLRESLRGDEVMDGFGLGEIEAPGEKGAARKLSGLGESGVVPAESECAADDVVEDDRRAVSGNLHEVFAGIGMGCEKCGDNGFVENVVVIIEHTCKAGLCVAQGLRYAEQALGDCCCFGAGKTYDANAAAARRCGDGDDGFNVVAVVDLGGLEFFLNGFRNRYILLRTQL